MKKIYVKPQMVAVKISQRENLLNASDVNGNAFNGKITRNNGTGRSRGYDWDDDEDW